MSIYEAMADAVRPQAEAYYAAVVKMDKAKGRTAQFYARQRLDKARAQYFEACETFRASFHEPAQRPTNEGGKP